MTISYPEQHEIDFYSLLPSFSRHANSISYKATDVVSKLNWSDEAKKFMSYINITANRELSFNLCLRTFTTLRKSNCYYCGRAGGGIDRVDSKIGYEEDNVVACCGRCNLMKHTMKQDDFISRARDVYLTQYPPQLSGKTWFVWDI